MAGAGRMGCGIAIAFAWAGHRVALVDSEERSDDAFVAQAATVSAALQEEIAAMVDVGLLDGPAGHALLGRIDVLARDASEPRLQAADYVFEAVAEVLDVKQATYEWLSAAAGPGTVFASTTSTMLSDQLAEFVTDAGRFTNAHWLNPAWLVPLVEISPTQDTRREVVDELRGLLESVGKVPVICRASPGYIVSRMQALVLNEAARLVEEGVASADDVDRAIRTGFGPRYTTFGPLEFIDWGGGDILYYASSYLAETIDPARFAPPDVVRENMAAGRNGMREGIGFYDWRDRDTGAFRRERLTGFARLLGHLGLLPGNAENCNEP